MESLIISQLPFFTVLLITCYWKSSNLIFLYIKIKLFGSKSVFCYCWNSSYLQGMIIPYIIYHSFQAVPCAIPTACLMCITSWTLIPVNKVSAQYGWLYCMCFSGQHKVCSYSFFASFALWVRIKTSRCVRSRDHLPKTLN